MENGKNAMSDALLDSLAQSLLSDGYDYPLTNGDLDFSLPPGFEDPPNLESLSASSSVGQDAHAKGTSSVNQQWFNSDAWQLSNDSSPEAHTNPNAQTDALGARGQGPAFPPVPELPQNLTADLSQPWQPLQYETATAFDNQGVTPTFSREAASQLGSYGKSGLEVLSTRSSPEDNDRSGDLSLSSNFKEKNRAAQRRYRERQKDKLHASEYRVERLTEELEKMKLQQQALAQRNIMLERLLIMQQETGPQQQSSVGSRAAIEGQKDAWWLDVQMKVFMEHSFSLAGELLFTVQPQGPLRMTQKQVAGMNEEQFDTLWKEYMNASAVLLIETDGDPATEAGRRLTRITHESGQLKASMLLSSPDRLHYKLAQSKVGGGHSDDVWLSMIHSSRLTEQQKEIIVAQRGVYLHNLGLLSRRRQDLTALLQAQLPMSGGRVTTCRGPTLASDSYSRTLSTMDALRDTLRDEHTCLLKFMLALWRRVLTPLQVAHMNVTSYPGHADIMRISELLAQQAGKPKSCAIMCSAASEPPGSPLVSFEQALPRSMRQYTLPGVDLRALYPHLSLEELYPQKQPQQQQQQQQQQEVASAGVAEILCKTEVAL